MKVAYVSADDWCGLYIDGDLVMEGHSLNVGDVIELLVPDADFSFDDSPKAYKVIGEMNRCPDSYERFFQ